MRTLIASGVVLLMLTATGMAGELEDARDRQDRAALEKKIAELAVTAARRPNQADAQYSLAVAQSYLAEIALEMRDKALAKNAAEAGIRSAERATALRPDVSDYQRVLGTLCGQVIPANVLSGLRYGKCAQDAVAKAIKLDPRSSMAYVSRGVGNYYLPPALGGGPELAIKDFQRAIQLKSTNAEAYLWLGIALRKLNRNAQAREAFNKSLELNPRRVWVRRQLEKTPAR
ncbi:MAG: tetratricopeptide repeat protein [Acidobacteriales bacterium]|nr:tetratricopeptide repeat protein [Terriglobales bacterium]